MSQPSIVWFDLDLRLADNPALQRALAGGGPVIPVFIHAPEEESPWSPGAASRWWLHQSLVSLSRSLAECGSRLIVRRGPSAAAFAELATETGALSVFWNRRYEPAALVRQRAVEQTLSARGIDALSCAGNVLFEPGAVLNTSGKPFQVFTPFWRACLAERSPAEPTRAPTHLPAPERWSDSLSIDALELEPEVDWAGGLRETWRPGERAAVDRLASFLDSGVDRYATERDRPDRAGTSRLSPHLHFGEISARQIWHQCGSVSGQAYLRQLAWREFSYHTLFHFPRTQDEPLRPEFRAFPWRMDAGALRAWTRGRTGYPIVDAGMREMWHTGWMHNRVRMVAASFLVKHLMIPWVEGARWFWDTLVDADLANNTMGWQWSAGCGADAAPYFRIFNPALQAAKFDPDGSYVRLWVKDQVPPIVDHRKARERALAGYGEMKTTAGS